MEQFNNLPLPQKLAILLVAMAAVAGLFYYAMIMPLHTAAQAAEAEAKRLQDEVAKIQKEAEKVKPGDIEAKKKAMEEQKQAFKERLPVKEELETFIIGISDAARNAGLKVVSFNKGHWGEQNFYLEIPIEMEVRGTYRELIGFLRTISEKDRRIVNVRDVKIERLDLPVKSLITKYEKQRREELGGVKTDAMGKRMYVGVVKPLDEAGRLMQVVRAYEESVERGVQLSAKFTAYVFTYTGKEATEKRRKDLEKQREERLKKRQARQLGGV